MNYTLSLNGKFNIYSPEGNLLEESEVETIEFSKAKKTSYSADSGVKGDIRPIRNGKRKLWRNESFSIFS